jgi:hypothetical protein
MLAIYLFLRTHIYSPLRTCIYSSSGAITIYTRMLGVINRHLYYDEPESAPTGYWSLSDIDKNKCGVLVHCADNNSFG